MKPSERYLERLRKEKEQWERKLIEQKIDITTPVLDNPYVVGYTISLKKYIAAYCMRELCEEEHEDEIDEMSEREAPNVNAKSITIGHFRFDYNPSDGSVNFVKLSDSSGLFQYEKEEE